MTTQQDQIFHTLLRSWNSHQHMRSANASIAELARSRAALDEVRRAAAREFRSAA